MKHASYEEKLQKLSIILGISKVELVKLLLVINKLNGFLKLDGAEDFLHEFLEENM